jgi:hypothetical protein
MTGSELYDLLTDNAEDTENRWRVDDTIIDFVIRRCHEIIEDPEEANEKAELVNSFDSDEQIEWLLSAGVTVEEIKEFVGKVVF